MMLVPRNYDEVNFVEANAHFSDGVLASGVTPYR